MSGKAKKKNTGSLILIRMLAVILVFLLCFAVLWTWALSQPKPNPFTSDSFAYVNGYLTCKTEKSSLGIDVSRYQGEIDWEKVREAGVEFAFIRLGYRSSGDGELSEDAMARKNLQGALAAGLEVGGYVFSQAMTPEEAREEAALAVSVVKDYEITLPLTFDWEFVEGNQKTDAMTKELLTQCIHSFCGEVRKAGYKPMVYFNRDLSQRLLDVYELTNYQIWFAMYDNYPDAPCKPDYWQYTNQGKVPGIEGNVDLNLRFLGS